MDIVRRGDTPCRILGIAVGLAFSIGAVLPDTGQASYVLGLIDVTKEWSILMTISCVLQLLAIAKNSRNVLWACTLVQGILWLFLFALFLQIGVIGTAMLLAPIFAVFSLYTTYDSIVSRNETDGIEARKGD